MSNVTCGVPQGSILGPLLFLLYINDINLVSDKVLPILFADDSNIFIHGKNIDEMIRIMNLELSKLDEWVIANKLSLNIEKTKFMIFSNRKFNAPLNNNISIRNNPLTNVNSIKFLGFILDNRLHWDLHTKHISNKIAKGVGIIGKARKYLPQETLKTLYYSFIYPYLTYGIEVWGCIYRSLMLPILKLQKKVSRIITNAPYRTPSVTLFNQLGLIDIHKLYIFKICTFMFKVEKGKFPSIISNMFVKQCYIHGYITRNYYQYHLPLFRTSFLQRNIRYKGSLYWNFMSQHVHSNCSSYL